MRLTTTQMQALPLLVLGAGLFVLAATVDVAPAGGGAETRIDIQRLHAEATTLSADPTACVDMAAPDCVIDVRPAGLIVAGP